MPKRPDSLSAEVYGNFSRTLGTQVAGFKRQPSVEADTTIKYAFCDIFEDRSIEEGDPRVLYAGEEKENLLL